MIKLFTYPDILTQIIYFNCISYMIWTTADSRGKQHRSSWDAKEEGNDKDYLHNLGAAQDYNSEWS